MAKENNGTKITLNVGDQELNFSVGLTEYNDLVNKMTTTNKVAPMHTFLQRCAANDDTKAMIKDLYQRGATLDVAGVLIEEFKPDLEITVKK